MNLSSIPAPISYSIRPSKMLLKPSYLSKNAHLVPALCRSTIFLSRSVWDDRLSNIEKSD